MYHQPQFILEGAKAHRTIKYTIPPGKKKGRHYIFPIK